MEQQPEPGDLVSRGSGGAGAGGQGEIPTRGGGAPPPALGGVQAGAHEGGVLEGNKGTGSERGRGRGILLACVTCLLLHVYMSLNDVSLFMSTKTAYLVSCLGVMERLIHLLTAILLCYVFVCLCLFLMDLLVHAFVLSGAPISYMYCMYCITEPPSSISTILLYPLYSLFMHYRADKAECTTDLSTSSLSLFLLAIAIASREGEGRHKNGVSVGCSPS